MQVLVNYCLKIVFIDFYLFIFSNLIKFIGKNLFFFIIFDIIYVNIKAIGEINGTFWK